MYRVISFEKNKYKILNLDGIRKNSLEHVDKSTLNSLDPKKIPWLDVEIYFNKWLNE